jgi:hypothetical protein
MFDGRGLRAYFTQFNEQYFGNQLPTYSIRVVRGMSYSGFCFKRKRLIKIKWGQSPEETIGVLLHEMAHAATNIGHGNLWKRKMIRLREAGAPVSADERGIDPGKWDGTQVSRRHFRSVVEDVLIDSPRITLSETLRHFMETEGGPLTIKAFLSKYPWVRAVFRNEKSKLIESQRQQAEVRARLGL